MLPPIHGKYTQDDVERVQSTRLQRALLIDAMLADADVEGESAGRYRGRC